MKRMNFKRCYWSAADWERLLESSLYRKDHTHSNLVAAFDLETSAVTQDEAGRNTIEDELPHDFAFMYIWQLGIEDIVVYGRTWDELRECLMDIHAALHLAPDYKLIVFDQKLKYDFFFFKSELEISPNDFLAKDVHEVLKCTVNDVFEFRDSKVYSERDLATMGVEVGYNKIEGFDYGLIRHALTPLSDFELEYCCRDVEILIKYFQRERDTYSFVRNIPITATRIGKDKIYKNFRDIGFISYTRSNQLRDTPEDLIMLGKLQKAFFGAFNYSDLVRENKIMHDVTYADMSTMYGSIILLEKFPLKKFKPLPLPESADELLTDKYKNLALLITIRVRDIENKYPNFLTLPVSKEWDYTRPVEVYKDKLKKAKKIIMTITDIDFKLLKQFYTCKSIDVLELYGSYYQPLPNYIIKTVVELIEAKKKKGAEMAAIEEKRKLTDAEQSDYNRVKTQVARIYGIFVQKPLLPRYTVNKQGIVEVLKDDEGKPLLDFVKKEHDPVLYQWGVWITSRGREWILRNVAAIAMEQRGSRFVNNNNVLYTDTDGLYALGDISHIIARHNAEIQAKLRYFCEMNRLYHYKFEDLQGIGEFKVKHFPLYKTIGLKKYAYVDQHGNFITKISGLSKDNVFFDKYSTNMEKLEALQPEMEIGAEEARNRLATYYNDKIEATVIDYTGQPLEITARSYIVLGVQKFDSRRRSLKVGGSLDIKKIAMQRNKCLQRSLLKRD